MSNTSRDIAQAVTTPETPRTAPTRRWYVAVVACTMVIGFVVHHHGSLLGTTARDIVGDALWAMMIVWITGAIAPHRRIIERAVVAYAVCIAVELGQLLDAPWLDAVRSTTLGHLVLGNSFDPRDLAAYALGVGVASAVESLLRRKGRARARDDGGAADHAMTPLVAKEGGE